MTEVFALTATINNPASGWEAGKICLAPLGNKSLAALAEEVYSRVCRNDFSEPGFCLLSVGSFSNSIAFRQWMVDLKAAMSRIHQHLAGKELIYLSAARFDQQTTTKPHRDGGPDECFLMLGYEPSTVAAEVEILDYSYCAHEMGMTPKEFLNKHNPMFRSGHELLRPYSTVIPCFASTEYQVVCINNSSAAFQPEHRRWQGTLHTARILTPDESARRIINSTMIAPTDAELPAGISKADVDEFVATSVVHRKGYDKSHLNDDH